MKNYINIGKFSDDIRSKDVIVEEMDNGCWHIISHKSGKRPYPIIYVNNKTYKVHRLIYERDVEKIKDGNVIRHKCDNPYCINPKHLIQGSQNDNIQDKIKRNRQAKGENIGTSKLTNEDVIWIYTFEGTYSDIKKKINVSYRTIDDIKEGVLWAWLTKDLIKGKRIEPKRHGKWNFNAISPNGDIYKSDNLTEFCKIYNLERGNVSACLRGKQKTCKGWKFELISNN